VGWPTAEISVMGPEGAVNIIFRKQIEAAGDQDSKDALRNQLVATVRSQIDAYVAAGWSFLDDLIDPADTRATIIRGLELGESKKVERPWRKHGVLPV
jgi:acetyl-CoA carboxylase carboxyltransferase component